MINKICIALLALFLVQAVALAKEPLPITDDSISDQVRVKLAGDQLVGVLNFQVTVKSGVVTLGGAVEQKSLKARAEKIAKKVKGVKSVVNNIEIKSRIPGR